MRSITLIILLYLLAGCSDFLEEVDQDKLIPSKTEHYASVLLDCINHSYPVFANVDFMADNVTNIAIRRRMCVKRKKRCTRGNWKLSWTRTGIRSGEMICGRRLIKILRLRIMSSS